MSEDGRTTVKVGGSDAWIGDFSPDGSKIAYSELITATQGNIVVAETDHLIATIGVDDLVIVHAPDATRICKKRDAQGIKELVDNINQRYGDRYK